MSDWIPTVVMSCACGGFLVADQANHRDVLYEVTRHNATERHMAWRGRGAEPKPRAPTGAPMA